MTGDKAAALAALMNPRSVAVIGATERADASSSFVMRNLLAKGFAGRIVPVHPRGGSVFGLAAATSMDAIAEPVDVAVIGLAADRAVAALDEAGQSGARAAVVLASGFAETGEAGAALQAELVAVANRHGMAVCGPNCLGLLNLGSGAALYASSLSSTLRPGSVAIVSHSGAGAIALANTGRFGLSHIVSTGNGAVTDLADYLDHLGGDARTRVVGLVIEAIRDPASFAAAMVRMNAAGKPVVAMRVGRSKAGARATAAHTGALAGVNEAQAAFLKRCGVVEVADMDGMVETLALLSALRMIPSRRGVAVVGVSGGGLAHITDMAEEAGLDLPDLADATQARLAELLPGFVRPRNPLDTTGLPFARPEVYGAALEALSADSSIGLVLAAQDAPTGLDAACAAEYRGIAEAFARHARQAEVPAVFLSNLSSGHHPDLLPVLDGVPVVNGTASGLRAVRAVLDRALAGVPEHFEPIAAEPRARRLFQRPPPPTEREAKALLAAHGLPVTREILAVTADAAVEAARAIGYPVVLKIESPDIQHKTEAGGVALDRRDETSVRLAFERIIANARAYAPEAQLAGVLVQEMVPQGVEALVGLVRHEPFGLGLTVGIGGVMVELISDAAYDLLPINGERASRMIDATRLGRLLAGFRGAEAADRAALIDLIVALSRFAEAHGDEIEAIDLNPVVILPRVRGARIVDALIVPRS